MENKNTMTCFRVLGNWQCCVSFVVSQWLPFPPLPVPVMSAWEGLKGRSVEKGGEGVVIFHNECQHLLKNRTNLRNALPQGD